MLGPCSVNIKLHVAGEWRRVLMQPMSFCLPLVAQTQQTTASKWTLCTYM